MRLWIAFVISGLLAGCSLKNNGGHSSVAVRIPTLAELNSKGSAQKVTGLSLSATDMTWDKACFMFTVTASDIPNTSTATCDLPNGVFSGSVAPSTPGSSQSVTLEVPKGSARRFDVYAYFRQSTTETCPVQTNINAFSKDRVARLGFTDNISLQLDAETVNIDISLPTQTILAQGALPASCSSAASSGPMNARAVSGTQTAVTTVLNGYKASTAVGGSANRISKTVNGYTVKRKRGTSQ